MVWAVLWTMECDGEPCKASSFPSVNGELYDNNRRAFWRRLRKYGWSRSKGSHYCPVCTKFRKTGKIVNPYQSLPMW